MITVEERAAELYDVIRACTLCALSETRTNAVPGEGPLDAEIMLIGEAPGVNEDRQGRPFVGAAGQFLSELLAAAGLTREQVYICNVLKCRPPGNRDPLPGEIEACSEYLDLQLDMVDPLVVITLGRFSMAKWFPQQAISRIHGSVKESGGRLIVPMYHPAAALHQGNLRQVLLDDFARVPAILQQARTLAAGPASTPPATASMPFDAGTAEPSPSPVPSTEVVPSGQPVKMEMSEEPATADASPHPAAGSPPPEDTTLAGSPDPGAANKPEQIRLFR